MKLTHFLVESAIEFNPEFAGFMVQAGCKNFWVVTCSDRDPYPPALLYTISRQELQKALGCEIKSSSLANLQP